MKNEKIIWIVQIVFSVWLTLFGLAVFISGFSRSATFFKFDFIIEVAIAIIGFFVIFGSIRSLIELIKTKKSKPYNLRQKKLFFIAIVVTLILAILFITNLLFYIPVLVQMVLLAGNQIASFLTFRISIVLDSTIVDALFNPIEWFFQVVYIYVLIDWFWPKDKKGKTEKKTKLSGVGKVAKDR